MVFLFYLYEEPSYRSVSHIYTRAEGNISLRYLSNPKLSKWYLARMKWFSTPIIGFDIQSTYLPPLVQPTLFTLTLIGLFGD